MIEQLFVEVAGLFCGLLLLAACGAWTLRAWGGSQLVLAAPLAGLGVLSATMSVLHMAGFEVRTTIWSSFALSMVLTFWLGRKQVREFVRWHFQRQILLAALVSTLVANMTSVWSGGAAIMLLDATDPFGYAQLADWLLMHSRADLPLADPALPYQSWIELVMDGDRRVGSYLLLSAATLIWGDGAIFVYPGFCALLTAAAILALIGLGAKRRRDKIWLWCAGLLAAWTTLAHTGFPAKLIAYPGAVLVVCLIIREGRLSVVGWFALLVLTGGYSVCLFGGAFALFLAAVWVCFAVDPEKLWRYRALPVFALGGYLIGLWQKPSGVGSPPPEFGLMRGLGIMLDVDAHLQPLAFSLVAVLVVLAILALATLSALAWRLREVQAMALLLAPIPVMVGGIATGRVWHLAQCTGFFFPLAVIGAMCTWRAVQDSREPWILRPLASRLALIAMVVFFVVRAPRFLKSMHRFGAGERVDHRVARRDLDQIVEWIDGELVEIRVPGSWVWALMPMIEFGRRGVAWTCDERTYQRLVGYRGWSMPVSVDRPRFVLASLDPPVEVIGEVVWGNLQYQLVRLPRDQ